MVESKDMAPSLPDGELKTRAAYCSQVDYHTVACLDKKLWSPGGAIWHRPPSSLLISGFGFEIRPRPATAFLLSLEVDLKCGTLSRLACRNISIDGVEGNPPPVIRPRAARPWPPTNPDLDLGPGPGRPDQTCRPADLQTGSDRLACGSRFPTRRAGTKKKWIRPRSQP